ncbi:glucose/galactose MFS transporter [Chromobacterium sphagni]|uniref:Glucose/galactose MFS transporter n=1 Tax=Chromobacterium sphagni TaxID=1903179 RepID=A0ABX3CBW1_9NEIS|nr:glucose/galactose MFS transporter [Chromobacterium sphagni]
MRIATHEPLIKSRTDSQKTIFLVTCTFFLWGMSYGLLDVLNKHFQESMNINKAQSGLLQLSYFSAYFVIALPAAVFNNRYGYKKGLIAGLSLFAAGALLFIPSLREGSFNYFISALFILACGLGFLEATANPYITQLGSQHQSEKRLNLAQSFCGLGTIVGPLIGGALFFRIGGHASAQSQHDTVMQVYIWISVFVVLLAAFIARTEMPEAVKSAENESEKTASLLGNGRFVGGVLAQFFYVAAQVGIGAFFINYATENHTGLSTKDGAWLLSVAMMLFMAGRFVGTYAIAHLPSQRLLAGYALANIVLSIIVIFSAGKISIIALMGLFFFMSIMYPTIFSLAIKDAGAKTKQAGSILTMAVSGGAVYPYLMGYIADRHNIAYAYTLPLASFVVIFLYGLHLEKNKALRPILATAQ